MRRQPGVLADEDAYAGRADRAFQQLQDLALAGEGFEQFAQPLQIGKLLHAHQPGLPGQDHVVAGGNEGVLGQFHGLGQQVAGGFDFVQVGRGDFGGVGQFADPALHGMGELAQVHGAGHARAALEGVQQAGQGVGGGTAARVGLPGTDLGMEAFHQLLGFFQEDGQQLLVHFVVQQRRQFGWGGAVRLAGGLSRGGGVGGIRGVGRLYGFQGCFQDCHHVLGPGFRPRRIELGEGVDQTGLGGRHLTLGQALQHALKHVHGLAQHFQPFEAVRVLGRIPA